jgi:ArsR family transcriptional regulator, arsenate/arsenite/antimonite-responsive transcriptional repressor
VFEPGKHWILRVMKNDGRSRHFSVIYFDDNGNMKEQEIVKALAALAHPNRLQVFRSLVVAGKAGATPGQLGEQLGVPNATLSFHLKELMNAGLISQERSGRNLIYRVEFVQMNGLLTYLTENCCQGAETCVDASATTCGC